MKRPKISLMLVALAVFAGSCGDTSEEDQTSSQDTMSMPAPTPSPAPDSAALHPDTVNGTDSTVNMNGPQQGVGPGNAKVGG